VTTGALTPRSCTRTNSPASARRRGDRGGTGPARRATAPVRSPASGGRGGRTRRERHRTPRRRPPRRRAAASTSGRRRPHGRSERAAGERSVEQVEDDRRDRMLVRLPAGDELRPELRRRRVRPCGRLSEDRHRRGRHCPACQTEQQSAYSRPRRGRFRVGAVGRHGRVSHLEVTVRVEPCRGGSSDGRLPGAVDRSQPKQFLRHGKEAIYNRSRG